MSYQQFINKPVSDKNVLVEIALGEDYNGGFWTNHGPSIWATRIYLDRLSVSTTLGSGAFGYGTFGSDDTVDVAINEEARIVDSVFIVDTFYSQAMAFNDLLTTPRSWFYDATEQLLYVRFDNGFEPTDYSSTEIVIGFRTSFAQKAGSYGGLYYQPLVSSIPSIKRKADPLFFGIIQFDGGNIKLLNNNNEMDDFHLKDYYGQTVRILFGETDSPREAFRTVYTGYVEKIDLSNQELQLSVKDKRKQLSRKLPFNHVSLTDYPYLDEDDDGRPLPFAYGTIHKAPAICLNPHEGLTTYTYKLVDTTVYAISSIDQVYLGDATVGHGNTNLIEATFTLPAATVDASDGEVMVDFQGYVDGDGNLIDHPLDVIQELLTTFGEVVYNNIFFNVDEWEQAKLGVPTWSPQGMPRLGLYLEKETKINEVIEKIATSILGWFIIQDDGRYTFVLQDRTREPVKRITYHDYVSPPSIKQDTKQYVSSVICKYDHRPVPNRWRQHINTSREATIFKRYKTYQQEEFETVLVDETAAVAFTENILDTYEEIKPLYTIETGPQNYDLTIGQTVELVAYYYPDTYGTFPIKAEVLGVDRQLNSGTVVLTLGFISSSFNLNGAVFIKTNPVNELAMSKITLADTIAYNPHQVYDEGDIVLYEGELWRKI